MTRQLDTTLDDSSPGVAYFVDCVAILFGLFASSRHALNALTAKFSHYLRTWLGRFLNRRTVASTFLLGAFNGLLPCGLVYAACAVAVTRGGLGSGVAYMASFGLGTIPIRDRSYL